MSKKLNTEQIAWILQKYSYLNGRILKNNKFKDLKIDKYRRVFFKNKKLGLNTCIAAHRVAWLLVFKKFPKNELDHINRNKLDNRIENLRECNSSQNAANRRSNKKYKGVSKCLNGKFKAQITLGTFDTAEEAAKKYDEILYKIHGEFALLNFPKK